MGENEMNERNKKMEPNESNELLSAISFMRKHQMAIIVVLLAAIVIYSGIYIRTLNIGGLKDVSTGEYTLAPDLDPFLYLRWAGYISESGDIPGNDSMRYYPRGFDTTFELTLPCHIISWIHKSVSSVSPGFTIEQAAIWYPVIFFCLFLLAFFLFVSKIFSDYPFSKWAALLATAIVSVIPGLLHRTIAGVPEKEVAGLCFMFFALYFITLSLKSGKWKWIFGLSAGLSTGLMGLVWGGVTFLFITIPLGFMLMFFFSDIKWGDVISYALWAAGFTVPLLTMTIRYGAGLFSPVLAGFAYFMLAILVSGKIFRKKWMVFGSVISAALLAIIAINPMMNGKGFFEYMSHDMMNYILKPFATDRITMTVAENMQVYFSTWIGSFGSPMFWIFMAGCAFISYGCFKSRTASAGFMALVAGMILSRYVPGMSPLQSNAILMAGAGIFLISLIASYYKNKKDKISLDKNLLLMVSILAFSIFCSRSAVRLFYFVYPFVPIAASFALFKVIEMSKAKPGDDEVKRYILIGLTILIGGLMISSLLSYHSSCVNEARYTVTGHYNAQWQMGMQWVRESTSQSAVFAHWWDYGYWVQTMGERATILDGGNSISYWNYLMGRLVLTGNALDRNESYEALSFLKTHGADYLLIDSSDIGKYPAYSTIGSDINMDRVSSMPEFVINLESARETRSGKEYLLTGGFPLDEDIIFGKRYISGSSGIIGFIIKINSNGSMSQPDAILVSSSKQETAPISCIYLNGSRIDFPEEEGWKKGIPGCLYLVPYISDSEIINHGSGIWLSDRLMKSMMVNLYILKNEVEGFSLAHNEESFIVKSIRENYPEIEIPSLVYYSRTGLSGPISIYSISYDNLSYGEIETNSEYLSIVYPDDNLWAVK